MASPTRRRRRQGGNGYPGIPALLTNLGGSSAVLALYDSRCNVTLNGGAVSQWDDARGPAGFGPALVQATGGKQPAWSAAAQTITFDGVDDNLSSAAVAAFDLVAARSAFIVAAVPLDAATKYIFGIADAAVLTRGLLAYFNTSNSKLVTEFVGAGATSDATPAVNGSATRRLIVASKPADGSSISADIPNVARVTLAHVGNVAAGNNLLVVGSRFDAVAGMPSTVRAVGVLDHQITAAELAALMAWARDNHGAVTA